MKWADYFYYDESSPSCLRWAVDILAGEYKSRVLVAKGDAAGSFREYDGYFVVGLSGKRYYAHQIVVELTQGIIVPKGWKVDHIDGNTLNNRSTNLRVVSNHLNARNMKMKHHNTSGVCGVSWANPNGVPYARAEWRALDGKKIVKMVPVRRYGLLPAFAVAVKLRGEAIEAMKQEGGYTERHGK